MQIHFICDLAYEECCLDFLSPICRLLYHSMDWRTLPSSKLTISKSISLSEICGIRQSFNSTQFPWSVSFIVDGVNRLGGTIISPFHILTVAHGFINSIRPDGKLCIPYNNLNYSAYRKIEYLRNTRVVAYGGKCIRGTSQKLPNDPQCPKSDMHTNRIRSVLIDDDFVKNNCSKGHDFAIVEVESRIKFAQNVIPICLPRNNMYHSQVLTVPGWGRNDIFNESGPLIHEIPMRIDENCTRPWSDDLPNDADDYLCAKSLDVDNYLAPRTCHGDSGAGMEYRDAFGRAYLIAMTSFGTRGCPSNMLARFTKIHSYLAQICEHTGVCYTI
ncbi:unnamed protein product [Caenorhabditis bovis]|uniref:Peptidase S1 domain-containing protein n=1 Tax=Caenorhabditis bovis TaxID=2654633 RepID=A0A8S1FEJ4_9PELO|nr:unnamed protein product [Caenorhabditis bovis]